MSKTPADAPTKISISWLFLGVLAVAALVRLVWVNSIQSPEHTVFSDMGAYVWRARVALGYADLRPNQMREMVIFPWGAHSWYAFLIGLLGPPAEECSQGRGGWSGGSLTAVSWAHGIFGSLTAGFAFLASRLLTGDRRVAVGVGLLVALWPPLLSFVGFFSSETPYAVFVIASVWLVARLSSAKTVAWDGAWAGLALAGGMVTRGQMLLTAVLSIGWVVARCPSGVKKAVMMALPLVLMLGFSSARYHRYTGEFGLVSSNGPLARLFAVSSYQRIENHQNRGYTPPARSGRLGFKGKWVFRGHITEAAPLDAERERIWGAMSWSSRGEVLQRNVWLLGWQNDLWPERNSVRYAKQAGRPNPSGNQWRRDLLIWHERMGVGLIGFAFIGVLASVRRREAVVDVALLHVATMIFSAAFFFGETRYRVPYDAVLWVVAAAWLGKGPRRHPVEVALLVGVVVLFLLFLATPF